MPMLDELNALIRSGGIEIPNKDLIREMITFVVWENGKPMAEEGCHDDRVMALGIGLQMEREHRHNQAGKIPEWKPEDTTSGL
jgi:hypothetical protein